MSRKQFAEVHVREAGHLRIILQSSPDHIYLHAISTFTSLSQHVATDY